MRSITFLLFCVDAGNLFFIPSFSEHILIRRFQMMVLNLFGLDQISG